MTEELVLTNIGLKGLSTDPAPWSLPPEYITYGTNFRIFAGSVVTDGGETLWGTAPANFYPSYPFHVGSTSGDFWLIAGRDAIYVFDGTAWTDLSSVAGYGSLSAGDERLWSGCMLGQIPVLSNPQHVPEYWAPQVTTQVMQPLDFDAVNTWADNNYGCRVMRSHRNFLFALSLIESASELYDSYRWSHPSDINGLPASWDETDDSFLAGKASLGGNGGRIIDGASLRDAFCIYSENSIDILDYTNDEFVWRRRELSATAGLLSQQSMVEVKGVHFFLSNGDILKNDGNKIDSVAHNRIRKDLSNRIDVDNFDRSYAVKNDRLKEIWFCVPEAGEDYANIAYIYNWKDDSWAIRDIVANIATAGYGSQSSPGQTWDISGETWDNDKSVWGSSTATPIDDTIIGANPVDHTLYVLDPRQSPDNDFNSVIERTNFPLLGQRQVTTITRVYPHIDGNSDLSIQFGSQDYPNGAIRWKPAITFNPSTQRKIDVRTTGELHAWRISSLGKGTWSMSGMTIEYVPAGLR